ncbi:hypothetical protein NQ315_005960 [Exocentrus adspersus]|uniref:Alanine--glyoxylate aminotransferase 2, mitochondrial n=1 Tax=Exocentrus adspersus TaxID=1586481 RepID=A0AAV8VBN2_9CUCU|nr:hypothetical protein NQ315_005960 [Exocentrus adspersus]
MASSRAVNIRLPPLPTVRDLVKLYRLRALRQLSQNFLMDERLTDKIVKAAGNIYNHYVCEVGPGPGGITRSIIKRCPKQLIVVEKDPRFLPTLELLQEACKTYTKMDIEIQDIVNYNLKDGFKDVQPHNWFEAPPPINIIGNLPFSVSTNLICRWLQAVSEKTSAWSYGRSSMTLTFQKEVGERMVAPPGHKQRCRLSVMCQFWCDVSYKFTIPGTAFVPKPDVDVAVVTLYPLKRPMVDLPFKMVEKLVRTIFNMRQKYAIRGASRLFPEEDRDILTAKLFKLADLSYTTRPFQLTNEEFVRICYAYKLICEENPGGPTIDQLAKIRKTHLNPALTTYYSKPLALHQGHKQWLFDINGNRYLDMFAGICTVSVGHCHPRITEAVTQQMQTLGHVSNVYYHSKIHEYSKRLADTLPANLKCIYFVNSGSEANDLALLMARAYTGKFDIVSLNNSYHGMTYQVMGMTSNNYYKYPVPGGAGFSKTMNPDIYSGIWGGNKCRDSPVQTDRTCNCVGECAAGLEYAKQFENKLNYDIPKNNIAAFWAESIQGVGGTVQYPKNYIKIVYDIVKKQGGLFVADEVQTGFGRTGEHFWGFEMHGIVPDIVTMAKGIGNGFPLAAVATTPEIAQGLTKAAHFNTYGGNPISCAVGIAVLDIIKDEKLQENSKEVGTYLLLELAKLKSQYPVIGDVRGKGLMVGVELVSDPESRKPLDAHTFMRFWEYCRDQRLIVGKGGLHGNVLRIKPPMCITKEDADFTVDVLEKAAQYIAS